MRSLMIFQLFHEFNLSQMFLKNDNLNFKFKLKMCEKFFSFKTDIVWGQKYNSKIRILF